MGGSKRARTTLSGCAALALSCVVGPSCRDPEQITIDFSTDVPCNAFAGLSVAVASLPHRAEADFHSRLGVVLQSEVCHEGKLGRLVIAQSDAPQAALVAVLAYKGGAAATECMAGRTQDCIFARRRIPFLKGTALSATVTLLAVCKGVACDVLSTCREGGLCYASDVSCNEGACDDPTQLASTDGGAGSSDARNGSADSGGDSARDGSIGSDGNIGSDDGASPSSGLRCGPGVQCIPGLRCCLRAAGDICVSAASDCAGMTDTLVGCYGAANCVAAGSSCVFTGTHGSAGRGFTTCTIASTGLEERACISTTECAGVGAGTYTCQSNDTSDPLTKISTCRP